VRRAARHLEARHALGSVCLVLLRLSAVCLLLSTVASAQGTPGVLRQPSVSPFAAAKARGLMRDRLPCTGCHALEGKGGRIGPDLSRVAERRPADYVRRMIEDPQRTAPMSIMPKVPMAPSTRELIIAYVARAATAAVPAVRAGKADTAAHQSSALSRGARDAAVLYGRYCAPCHGARGRGDGPNAAYLSVPPTAHADSALMARRSDDRLFDAIYSGGYPLGRSVAMPAYGETFTRQEVWSLVRYLRQLCKCSGPGWSTDGDRPRDRRSP